MGNITDTTRDENWAIAGLITARHGNLAIARAAGEAARSKDPGRRAIWLGVVAHLRRSQ